MSYPSGPYGGGFVGQPPIAPPPPYPGYPPPQSGVPQQLAYPQQAGYPYPQFGYPGGPQPQGVPPRPTPPPSGVTGIIAGVLAGLGGVANVVLGAITAIGLAALANDRHLAASGFDGVTPLIAIEVLNVIVGVVLVAGAVTLFLRKSIGRWLVVAGCAVYIAGGLVSLAISLTMSSVAGRTFGGNAFGVVGLVFPIATLVLALLPSTAAWLRAKQQRVPPQYAPQYPPYQG